MLASNLPHRPVHISRLLLWVLMIPSMLHAQKHGFVPDWVGDAVFYQIFPERFANGDHANDPPRTEPWGKAPTSRNFFGGDLRGIRERLAYLADLGVNTLYLNPIFDSPSNHKYNTRDYMKVDPHFGGDAELRNLLDSCHARGIRVILDGVFNHTGVDFFAFRDVKEKGSLSPYKEWYYIKSFPIGPVDSPNYECWWGYGALPKLNTDHPGARAYLFDVTRKWMEFGIDGWRLDVPNEIPHDFWVEWRRVVKGIRPDAYIVGEIWQDGQEWLRGDQFDAVMNYRFRDACVDFFARQETDVSDFDQTLARVRADYPHEVQFALQNLLGSHDTERFLTVCGGDIARVKLAVLFQMTYIGAPMVYYGDEIGMTGGKDPGCRSTMIWDETGQNREIFQWFQRLIRVREAYASLRRGSFETALVRDEERIYGFARVLPSERAVVLLNAGEEDRSIDVDLGKDASALLWRVVFPDSGSLSPRQGENHATQIVPAGSGVVLIGERKQ